MNDNDDANPGTEQGPPDAVLFREEHKQGRSAHERAENLRARLAPVLGSARAIHVAKVEGHGYLARAVIDHAILDLDRKPRFRWVEQPDGVLHGWLIDGGGRMSFTANEDAERAIRLANRFNAAVDRWRELKDRDPATLSPAEADLLQKLSATVEAVMPELTDEGKTPE